MLRAIPVAKTVEERVDVAAVDCPVAIQVAGRAGVVAADDQREDRIDLGRFEGRVLPVSSGFRCRPSRKHLIYRVLTP